jgi:hypothetical protein
VAPYDLGAIAVRIVGDVISVIRGSIELWPTLVEIAYFQKRRYGLPQLRVRNQRKIRGLNVSAKRSPRQKRTLSASCTTRGSPAEVIVPNAADPKTPFGAPSGGVFVTLNTSARSSSERLVPRRTRRIKARSRFR